MIMHSTSIFGEEDIFNLIAPNITNMVNVAYSRKNIYNALTQISHITEHILPGNNEVKFFDIEASTDFCGSIFGVYGNGFEELKQVALNTDITPLQTFNALKIHLALDCTKEGYRETLVKVADIIQIILDCNYQVKILSFEQQADARKRFHSAGVHLLSNTMVFDIFSKLSSKVIKKIDDIECQNLFIYLNQDNPAKTDLFKGFLALEEVDLLYCLKYNEMTASQQQLEAFGKLFKNNRRLRVCFKEQSNIENVGRLNVVHNSDTFASILSKLCEESINFGYVITKGLVTTEKLFPYFASSLILELSCSANNGNRIFELFDNMSDSHFKALHKLEITFGGRDLVKSGHLYGQIKNCINLKKLSITFENREGNELYLEHCKAITLCAPQTVTMIKITNSPIDDSQWAGHFCATYPNLKFIQLSFKMGVLLNLGFITSLTNLQVAFLDCDVRQSFQLPPVLRILRVGNVCWPRFRGETIKSIPLDESLPLKHKVVVDKGMNGQYFVYLDKIVDWNLYMSVQHLFLN